MGNRGFIKGNLTFNETRRYDFLLLLSIIFPDRMTEEMTQELECLQKKLRAYENKL